MGVDYAAVSGYGFTLDSQNDDLEELAKRAEYEYDEDDFDPYEFIDWLCGEYEVDFSTAGDAYTGEVTYLIGSTKSISLWGLEETGINSIGVTDELTNKLTKMLWDLNLNKKLGYYSGMYVY